MNKPLPAANQRVKQIFERVVEKLKEVVTEFEITQDELHAAGDYFNRLGQSGFCRSLIDVALAMTSVDATARTQGGTRPNLEGPFHRANSPMRDDGDLFDLPPSLNTPTLNLSGRITDAASGEPLAGAVLDVWQADHNGSYDREHWHLAGRITPDVEGRYALLTAVPRDYSDHDSDPIGELFSLMGRHNRRAAHIHCKIWIGSECVLTTQLFIAGNAYLDSDYVEGAVSDDLILRLEAGEGDNFTASFDFAVRAPGERSA